MIILINCFMAVFLSSVTGTILFALWGISRKFFSNINPLHVYFFLKIVCLGYLIPVVYVMHCIRWNRMQHAGGFIGFTLPFEYTTVLRGVMMIVSVIWGILTVFLLRKRVIKAVKRLRIFRKLGTAVKNERYSAVYQQAKENLEIKREIPLLQNELIVSPVVYSFFRPVILIGHTSYSESDLKHIFTHELTHWKSGDLFWKTMVLWISALQSFNPLCLRLWREVDRWSEISCDIHACRDGKLNVESYYDCIVNQIEKHMADPMDEDDPYLSSMLFKQHSTAGIGERMFYMGRYQNRQKKKALLGAMMIMVLSFGGMVISHAAGQRVIKQYQELCDDTRDTIREDIVSDDNKTEEYILMPEAYDADAWIEGEVEKSSSRITAFGWEVAVDKRTESPAFHRDKNDTITISADCPEGNNTYVGILEPDGRIRYVAAIPHVHYVFSLNSSGLYKVIVQNPNETAVGIVGYYY